MMTTDSILAVGGVLIALSATYAIGRLHQWMRQTNERDLAFREGYDAGHARAVHSMPRVISQIFEQASAGGRHGQGPRKRVDTQEIMAKWRQDQTLIERN